MAHFYGFSHKDMMDMDTQTFYAYYDSITAIEAQNAILGTTVATFPHMKPADRKKLNKRLNNNAYPIKEQKPTLSSEDAAEYIQRMLNNG
jgi:hypothetical protein